MKTNKLGIFAIALLLMTLCVGIAVAEDIGTIGTHVTIDIKPGSDPNSINMKSNGVISVAILTTDDFDATMVEATTVRFGPNEAQQWKENAAIEDVDGDGDQDLVLHFKVKDTGIQAVDIGASLTGYTYDGIFIEGSDSIRTVPTD